MILLISAFSEVDGVIVIAELYRFDLPVIAVDEKLRLSSLVKAGFNCISVDLESSRMSAVVRQTGSHPEAERAVLFKGQASLII